MSRLVPVDLNGEPLALLTIHAHPDDESSKGAGTVAALRRRGHPDRPGVLHRR